MSDRGQAPARLTQPAGSTGPDGAPEGAFPLSAAQFGQWLSQQLQPEVPVNMAQYVELRGGLDQDLFERVLVEVGKGIGSPYLRLVDVDGTPYQIVDRSIEQSLIRIDFSGAPDPRSAAQAWMRQEYTVPLDLYSDHLFATAMPPTSSSARPWIAR